MNYRKNFGSEMKRLKKDIFKRKNKEEGVYWIEVNKFILEGRYSSYKNIQEFVRLLMDDYSIEAISVKLNIQESTVRVQRKNVSDTLYNIFGDDFFEWFNDFYENKEKLYKVLFLAKSTVSSNYISNLIPVEVQSIVSDVTKDSPSIYSLDDAYVDYKKEINFLVRHSLNNIKRECSELDPIRLSSLMHILVEERNNPSFRDLIYEVTKRMEGVE